MNKRLIMKRNKGINEKIEEIALELDRLMDQYICSDDIYGDFDLFSKINKLKEEKKKLTKIVQASSKNSKSKKIDRLPSNNICINDISFKLVDASFKISYKKNGRSYCEVIPICKNDMYRNSVISKEIKSKYGIDALKTIDVNLYSALSKFDLEKGTNYAFGYANGEKDFSIKYQFDNFYQEHVSLSILDKMKIRKMAKRNGYEPCSEVKAKYLAPAIVSLAVLVGAYGGIKNYSDKVDLANSVRLEQDDTDKEIENSNYNSVVDSQNVSISNEIDDVIVENVKYSKDNDKKDNVKIVSKKDIETKIESKDKNKNKNKSKSKFKLKDKYYLDSVDLSISSMRDEPSVNTDELDCDYYKVNLVSVSDDHGVKECKSLDTMKNKSLEAVVDKYLEKYGDDISVSVNFDGYNKQSDVVYGNVGWVDLIDLTVDKNKTNKSKIKGLKSLKKVLKNGVSNNSKEKVYKKL